MKYPLRATEEEHKQFEEQGFFVRESVFSSEEVEALRAGVENIHQQVLDASAAADAPAGELIDNQLFQELLGSTIKWEWDEKLKAVRSMEPMAHLDSRIDAFVDEPR
ncbi:MAG: hypothetical protein JRC77_07385, partial [Deltaproteobacteria bacterium]|nr:hypothetical protein [Deltaproteobacteria bacterium]